MKAALLLVYRSILADRYPRSRPLPARSFGETSVPLGCRLQCSGGRDAYRAGPLNYATKRKQIKWRRKRRTNFGRSLCSTSSSRMVRSFEMQGRKSLAGGAWAKYQEFQDEWMKKRPGANAQESNTWLAFFRIPDPPVPVASCDCKAPAITLHAALLKCRELDQTFLIRH